uniref:SFRICE_014137 n=1 Tax=Spodoptera frugiperda TaxID=7108 RepID=A0A2H1WTY2_SPOFR
MAIVETTRPLELHLSRILRTISCGCQYHHGVHSPIKQYISLSGENRHEVVYYSTTKHFLFARK